METWIHDEILDGLSKLLCLSLERTPAADMIAGTAMAWAEALTTDRLFDRERDVPRFRHAFRKLAAQRRSWPAPADFMEAFHATRPEVQLLTKQVIPANPQRAAAACAEIAEALRGKTAAAGPDA